MEKSTDATKFTRSFRLLKKIAISVLILCVQTQIFSHMYSEYVLKPVDKYIFTDQDCIFETIIPNLRTVDVLVMAQNLPDKVTFISSDKREFLDENGKPCLCIRIIYRFDDVGYYKMTPLTGRIKYGTYSLPVENVNVFHNLETIQPFVKYKLLDEQAKNYTVGSKIPLQLTVSFAKRISGFTVDLQENSALCKTHEDFKLPSSMENFSDIEYPIANFYFIPFEEGLIKVPQVNVQVCTWKGINKTSISEPLELHIKKNPNQNQIEKNLQNSLLEQYKIMSVLEFSDESGQNLNFEEILDKKNKIELIAGFRNLERNKIFNKNIIEERKFLEEQIGLTKTQNEISNLYFYGFLLLLVIFIVSLTIGLVLRKKVFCIIMAILLCCSFVCVLIFGINKTVNYALILDEKIYSIPENDSNLFFTLPMGSRVKIKNTTKEWIYIIYSETSSGWIKRESLIFLN
ncbi:MAG: hypothetical protein ACTTHG_03245 [Treponemataceae bacterium]